VVVELVPLCKLGELLALVLCFLATHLFNELFPDMTFDEAIVFVGCLPSLHVVLIEF
jgi:hypothetical protein